MQETEGGQNETHPDMRLFGQTVHVPAHFWVLSVWNQSESLNYRIFQLDNFCSQETYFSVSGT